jgi:hypothetical protein
MKGKKGQVVDDLFLKEKFSGRYFGADAIEKGEAAGIEEFRHRAVY